METIKDIESFFIEFLKPFTKSNCYSDKGTFYLGEPFFIGFINDTEAFLNIIDMGVFEDGNKLMYKILFNKKPCNLTEEGFRFDFIALKHSEIVNGLTDYKRRILNEEGKFVYAEHIININPNKLFELKGYVLKNLTELSKLNLNFISDYKKENSIRYKIHSDKKLTKKEVTFHTEFSDHWNYLLHGTKYKKYRAYTKKEAKELKMLSLEIVNEMLEESKTNKI